jgi:redox-sensitive bicupin YhaK (pirin superfamily)
MNTVPSQAAVETIETTQRALARVRTLPPPSRGQFGPDHTAIEVIRPGEWIDADPFILMMDDRVDGRLMAGPHPHAGFETVTFIVDGEMTAEHRGGGALGPGDVEWTTAGSGIIHGPDAPLVGRIRVLQLWLTLPKAQRWTEPDHQLIRRSQALVRREGGVEVTLYSGATGALVSPTRNRVPVTVMDVRLPPAGAIEHAVPAGHTGFLYVLGGEVLVGAARQPVESGQIGWLERASHPGETSLLLASGSAAPARVLLYTGERQNDPIVSYGPFIGDTRADIVRSFERYQSGAFRRV